MGSPKAGLTAYVGDDIAEDPTTGIGYANVVSVLTEVKRAGIAYDFERSNATMRKCGAALPAGFDGRKVLQQLVRVCAGVEKQHKGPPQASGARGPPAGWA